jgi:anti-sigma factor RsiW
VSPRRHLDDLFSSAYEDELSPIEEARFQSHIQTCAPCAAAYAEFRQTIESLHELPRARMPHIVHLPSTPPVAERSSRPRIGLSRLNLGVFRRFPATAIAGAVAVVLVIAALAHTNGTPQNTASGSARATIPNAAPAAPASESACAHSINGAALPSSFTQQNFATDSAQPAFRLVLAAPTLVVHPGMPAVVYAELTEPVASISNPGTSANPPSSRAVLPCVSVGVGSTSERLAVLPASGQALDIPQASPAAGSGVGAPVVEVGGGAGPLLTFQVPPGLAANTELHVIATIPAGYAGPGSPPLRAELTLTTG